MRPKKNPKADLSKKLTLFFQIGLILVLFASWQLIEMKSYNKNKIDPISMKYASLLTETDVPVVIIPNSQPPVEAPTIPEPVIKNPTVFSVVPNDPDRTIPKTNKTKQTSNKIAKISDIPFIAPNDPIVEVPFKLVENVPIFPGCEKYDTNEERRQCMSAKVQEFVNNHFDTDLAEELGLFGNNRIQVLFKIDSEGKVVDVKAHAAHPRLQQEAVRVIKSLPDMEPGKQRGKPVEVLYSLPIIFQVQ